VRTTLIIVFFIIIIIYINWLFYIIDCFIFIYLFIYLSIYLFIYLSIYLFIYLGLSREYFEKGFLDFTDRVEDGFYDAGRSGEFKPYEELISLDRAREVRPPHNASTTINNV
jgi:hypothetical protein